MQICVVRSEKVACVLMQFSAAFRTSASVCVICYLCMYKHSSFNRILCMHDPGTVLKEGLEDMAELG